MPTNRRNQRRQEPQTLLSAKPKGLPTPTQLKRKTWVAIPKRVEGPEVVTVEPADVSTAEEEKRKTRDTRFSNDGPASASTGATAAITSHLPPSSSSSISSALPQPSATSSTSSSSARPQPPPVTFAVAKATVDALAETRAKADAEARQRDEIRAKQDFVCFIS